MKSNKQISVSTFNWGPCVIKLKIEELTKDFNTRSKGFLNNISFDFKDKVKMVDKTPLASTIKDADLLLDLDKSINQSNAYFRSLGES